MLQLVAALLDKGKTPLVV